MCGSRASMQNTSGSLSPSGKITILSSRAWGVMLAPAPKRVRTPSNPLMLGQVLWPISRPWYCWCVGLVLGSGRAGIWECRALGLGRGGRQGFQLFGMGQTEFRDSLLLGAVWACLACLCRRSPERGRASRPLMGKPWLSVPLDLQESDRQRKSADAFQDLVNLTGPCFWRPTTHVPGW